MTKTPTPSSVARHATKATNSAQVIDLTERDRSIEAYRTELLRRSQKALMAFDLLLARPDWHVDAYLAGGHILTAELMPAMGQPEIIDRCRSADGRLTPAQFVVLANLAEYEAMRASEMLILYLTLRHLGKGHAANAIIGKEERTNGWRDDAAACQHEIARAVRLWDNAGLERLTGQRVRMSDPVLML